ncbi:MAG: tRNA (adenosine(37)-N6)-threonylcarbamoyltransferase complex dimerization subunit type 1 TsaB [Oligoflexia bacterium]|nr:tRNA (adenosine(37)-N6)-threonylcarbamoyltransferase complex dimerization subunit type 1 TsaB [Oligoflexia bacterium]
MGELHLALDTSSSIPIACIAKKSELLLEWSGEEGMKHHETLLQGIHSLFSKTKTRPQDLSFISVGIGPGLFTGLRIGITTAKFLAEPITISCVPVSSLEALLYPYLDSAQRVWAIGDARSGRIYYRSSLDQDDSNEKIGFPDDLSSLMKEGDLACGEGALLYKDKWPSGIQVLETPLAASSIAHLGYQKFQKSDTLPPEKLDAKYLKIDSYQYEKK